jgi:hypothetical protein
MAYESLPLHLLKTVKELREVGLNPYYFELHISIDNADSGHAAMAMAAVANYIELIEHTEGLDAAQTAWKRVQAGYILAEGLPTTPESPSLKTSANEPFPRTETEATMVDIFAAKSFVAHKIHCNSRLRIGRRSLVDWLEPTAFKDVHWQKAFLQDLSNCKPWVIKGSSAQSRLVKELSWEGKMFGSFTQTEVEVVKAWIDELGKPTQTSWPDATAYLHFTKRQDLSSSVIQQDILADYPVLLTTPPASVSAQLMTSTADLEMDVDEAPTYTFGKLNISNFLPLWFASMTLLESLPSVPVRAADTFGSALVRVLRAQTGFDVEGLGVAGMDEVRRTDNGDAIGIFELGFAMCHRAGIDKLKSLRDAVALGDTETVAFAEWMAWMSMRWLTHRDILIGMAWAFLEIHEMVAGVDVEQGLLDQCAVRILKDIAARERVGLEVCRREIEADEVRNADFRKGVAIGRRGIQTCFNI